MTLYKQAICFICTCDIWTESIDDLYCLWDDKGHSGRPVCWDCYWLLKMYRPEKLVPPLTVITIEKIGLEKWL